MQLSHWYELLLDRIDNHTPIILCLQLTNLAVFTYVLLRCLLAWRRHWKLPTPAAFVFVAFVPLLLSTVVSFCYLSELPTDREYVAGLSTMTEEQRRSDEGIDPTGSLLVGQVLLRVDGVRISLYSGSFFTVLTLLAVYVCRKLNVA